MLVAGFFVVFVTSWELLVVYLGIPQFIVPKPTQVLQELVRGLTAEPTSRGSYLLHAYYTLLQALAGFFLGSCLGVLLGTLLSQIPLAERVLRPYIVAFQSVPRIALAPVFMVWFGLGLSSKIVLATLGTFFPLMINAMAGFRSVEDEKVELLRSLSASRWQIFRMVTVPTAMPYIFAGLEIAILHSVTAVIVGEFIGAKVGLGVLLVQLNFNMEVAGVFAVFIVLSAMGIGLSTLVYQVRRRVLFWAPEERKQRTIGT